MSTSSSPDKPNRLVVALGIATIVLFSANLLSMISQRVWPKLQDMAVFENTQQADEVAPAVEENVYAFRRQQNPAVFHIKTRIARKKRCYRQHDHAVNHADVDVQVEGSIDTDMDRLEREIEREMERLNSELSDAQTNLENAISVRLKVDGGKTIVLDNHKLDLADLEAKIEGITKQFEVRVREHEAAARKRIDQ